MDKMLTPTTPAGVGNALAIVRQARQAGPYATKYSNVFDLKTGNITLLPIPGDEDVVTLNLASELVKGAHYYDLPQIKTELAQPPRPLPKCAWWRFW